MLKEKDYLQAKANGVKDCVKWVEDEIKEKRKNGEYADPVEIKIGLEKYGKKLRYQANEAEWNPKPSPKEDNLISSEQMKEMITLLKEGKTDSVVDKMEYCLFKAGHPDAYDN